MKKIMLILCPLLSFMLNSCYNVSDVYENVPDITDIVIKDITEDSFGFEAYYTGLHVHYDWDVTYIFKVSEYETMSDCMELGVVAESYEIYETGSLNGTVQGLKPDTEYWYQFVLTDGLAVVESDVFSLRTLKSKDNGGVDSDEYALDEALALSDDTYVELTGVAAAVTQHGFLLSDDDADMLYVYAGAGWTRTVDVGDKVVVDGTMATYHNNRELRMNDVAVSGTASVPYTSAYKLTEDNLSGFAGAGYAPMKIQVTGELTFDGTYYEIYVGDSPIIVSLTYPVIDMDDYVGEYVSVTGYYIWTSTSSSNETIVSIILTEISVTDRPSQSPIDTSSASDLNASGETANCYIVSKYGTYKFDSVKGNSDESVGSVHSVAVLWESFGTSVTPAVGALIDAAGYKNGHVYFRTASSYREGNAVIAAKDDMGTILWSWHIWLTDQPEEQVYYNNAGTMMDRNLGATSATPGDVGALGLLYQWGRKDPFLGSSSISESIEAVSTITWPSSVSSSSDNGTIYFAIQNPTTFISYNSSNYDWYYTGDSSTDDTRWQSDKAIYDPCPAGWRVPDGGPNGVWIKALGFSTNFIEYPYDETHKGMNFSGKFGNGSHIWYPAAGYYVESSGILHSVGGFGGFWSVSQKDNNAYTLGFIDSDFVVLGPASSSNLAVGQSVRCLQE